MPSAPATSPSPGQLTRSFATSVLTVSVCPQCTSVGTVGIAGCAGAGAGSFS